MGERASSLQILQDPYFQSSLALAKGAAARVGAKKLSPLLLLVGFQLAQRSPETKVRQAIEQNREAIERAVSQLRLDLAKAIEPVTQGTMPLTQELSDILKSSGSDFDALVPALLKAVARDESLDTTIKYASSLATKYGLSEITPEIFTVAAFTAYKDGRFMTRPSVSAHIAANRSCFVALIEEEGWSIDGLAPTTSTLLSLNHELQNALENIDESSDKLIAAIDVGMMIGAKLISVRRTAYHEAGHAMVSSILRPNLPVAEVNIIREGGALGVTKIDDKTVRDVNDRREDFLSELCVALAGRAAELAKFGPDQMDEGASSDIEQATKMAWGAIARFGLDPEFGPIDLSALGKAVGQPSGWLFDRAQQRLQEVLKEASERAEKILHTNWAQVEKLVAELMAKKKLSDDDLIRAMLEKSLAGLPGVGRARKRPVERDVTFARTAGVHETLEGPVLYNAGDAIVVGEKGESWPVKRETFDRLYEPVGNNKPGQDGRYRKIVKDVLALQLDEAKRLDLPSGRGLLRGRAGDWIVDYGGDGDMAVVAADAFAATYEVLDTTVAQPSTASVAAIEQKSA
jgi:Peptidase family M41/PGDYG protein